MRALCSAHTAPRKRRRAYRSLLKAPSVSMKIAPASRPPRALGSAVSMASMVQNCVLPLPAGPATWGGSNVGVSGRLWNDQGWQGVRGGHLWDQPR